MDRNSVCGLARLSKSISSTGRIIRWIGVASLPEVGAIWLASVRPPHPRAALVIPSERPPNHSGRGPFLFGSMTARMCSQPMLVGAVPSSGVNRDGPRGPGIRAAGGRRDKRSWLKRRASSACHASNAQLGMGARRWLE